MGSPTLKISFKGSLPIRETWQQIRKQKSTLPLNQPVPIKQPRCAFAPLREKLPKKQTFAKQSRPCVLAPLRCEARSAKQLREKKVPPMERLQNNILTCKALRKLLHLHHLNSCIRNIQYIKLQLIDDDPFLQLRNRFMVINDKP